MKSSLRRRCFRKARRAADSNRARDSNRAPQGVALVAALVVLAIVSLLMSAIAWQMFATQRLLEHRGYGLQADWLARAGIELAAAKLLADPSDYRGETAELVAQSAVEITVQPDSDGMYVVVSRATYPLDVDDYIVRTQRRRLRVINEGDTVRIAVSHDRAED